MKASYVSSQAVTQALRYSMMRAQSELVKAQTEASTSRVADVGLALGVSTARTVSLARDVARLEAIADSNGLVSSRLSSTQDALAQITGRAETFRSTLTAAVSGDTSDTVLKADAKALMESLHSVMNSTFNGEYLFAGINTDVQPLADFNDPASPARVAFDASFVTHFGFPPTDAAASGITAAQMDDFIANVVEPQFFGADWNANWSNATAQTITSRIAINETAQTSVSANISGVRKLAMAAAIAMALPDTNISPEATESIVGHALSLTAEAVGEIAEQQARMGIIEQRVKTATERMETQIDLFNGTIRDLEGVDPYEAATRVSALMTQIETSYSLTARIQQLSLLRFLA